MKPTAETIDIAAQAIESAKQRGRWRVARYQADRASLRVQVDTLRTAPEGPGVANAIAIVSALEGKVNPTVLHHLTKALPATAAEPADPRPGPTRGQVSTLDAILAVTGGRVDIDEQKLKAPKVFSQELGTVALIRWCIWTSRSVGPALANALADSAIELWSEYQGSSEQILDNFKKEDAQAKK